MQRFSFHPSPSIFSWVQLNSDKILPPEQQFPTVEKANQEFSYLRKQRPALTLMDTTTLEVDGYTQPTWHLLFPHHALFPSMRTSAYAAKGNWEHWTATNCDGYTQEPVDVDAVPYQNYPFLERC